MTPVVLEDTTYLHVGACSATTGAATNADSAPTVTIEEDGVAMGYAPAVANVATGLYRVTIVASVANGFEAGKRYSVYVAATVGGVTGRDGIGEFECVARSLGDLAFPVVSGRGIDVDATGGVEITAGQNVSLGTDAITAAAMAADAIAEIQSGLASSAQVDALEGDTATLLARLTAGRASNLDFLDALISSRLAAAGYTAPDNASVATILTRTDVAISTRLAAGSYVAPDNAGIVAIKAKTDSLTFTIAGRVDANILAVATQIAELWQRLALDPTRPMSTSVSQIQVDSIVIDMVESPPGTIVSTRQP